jgi:hypothetical protein
MSRVIVESCKASRVIRRFQVASRLKNPFEMEVVYGFERSRRVDHFRNDG